MVRYINVDFQKDPGSRASMSRYVFIMNGVVIWRRVEPRSITESTYEDEYVAASEASKEAIWLRNFSTQVGSCSIC